MKNFDTNEIRVGDKIGINPPNKAEFVNIVHEVTAIYEKHDPEHTKPFDSDRELCKLLIREPEINKAFRLKKLAWGNRRWVSDSEVLFFSKEWKSNHG